MSKMKFLKVGDKAPNFAIKDQNGRTHQLIDYRGKKLVLYFYPKDNTPGCTAQACNIRDNYQALLDLNISILGISADSEQAHQKFIEKKELPFDLLADTEKEMLHAYGVFGLKKFMGREYDGIHRTTFLINEEGIIHGIIEKPKTTKHSEEIIELFQLN
jgi:thioredoxin-dependent peroxiredoxin